jgi:uncharacterized protein
MGRALLVGRIIMLSLTVCFASSAYAQGSALGEFQEVRVHGVHRDPRSAQPVVLLADLQGQRGMFIWIGDAEAAALDAALQGVTHRRPMTHDLLASVIETFHGRIRGVRVTGLREDVYFAAVDLDTPTGPVELDARPSDAMVLAVRAKCPISVEVALFSARSLPMEVRPLAQYGMEVQELTEGLKAVLRYEGRGLLVSQVETDGLAERSGLRHGDVIMEAAEKVLTRAEEMEKLLPASRSGLGIKIFRKGEVLSLTLPPPREP